MIHQHIESQPRKFLLPLIILWNRAEVIVGRRVRAWGVVVVVGALEPTILWLTATRFNQLTTSVWEKLISFTRNGTGIGWAELPVYLEELQKSVVEVAPAHTMGESWLQQGSSGGGTLETEQLSRRTRHRAIARRTERGWFCPVGRTKGTWLSFGHSQWQIKVLLTG